MLTTLLLLSAAMAKPKATKHRATAKIWTRVDPLPSTISVSSYVSVNGLVYSELQREGKRRIEGVGGEDEEM